MASQRQITLPLSKAIEIAYRSIRLRLSRSLLVTSGIILAIAFLMSILTSQTVIAGMRNWATATSQQNLLATMRANGVPITAQEVLDDRIQTRWLAGLALLVAFVGILNAMLMSVTERFREIGTMKCLGALDSFIIKLFLIESLFQGITGSAIGVLVGMALSIISAATKYGGAAFHTMPVFEIAFKALVCFFVGIVLTVAGALYPSWQAARMQPIEAMRADT
jgi:putative ABC transport system permease protein